MSDVSSHHIKDDSTFEAPAAHVVIPTTGRPHLVVALASVKRQSCRTIPVIVDDRRHPDVPLTDLFPELQHLRDHQVLVTGGVGLAAARNIGLEAVGGAATLLLDDDDVWCPHHAERVLTALSDKPDAPFAWSGSRVVTWGEGIEAEVTNAGFGWDRIRSELWSTNFVPPSSVLIRSAAVLRFNTSLTELEDWDAWLRLLEMYTGEPAFTRVITMGYGRDIVSKASMVMAATFKPERQASIIEAQALIAAAHPIPEESLDRRLEVADWQEESQRRTGTSDPLPFDHYERFVAHFAGPPIARKCCEFDFAHEYDILQARANQVQPPRGGAR